MNLDEQQRLADYKAAATSKDKLKYAIELLQAICDSHMDKTHWDYNECDKDPCFFCELVKALKR